MPSAVPSDVDDYLDAPALLDLLENSGDGFAVVDAADGVYLHLNAAGGSALGSPARELVGTRSPWPVPDHGTGELATQLGGRDYTYRATVLHAKGRTLHAIQFRDVTAERRRESQLRAFSLSASNIAYADSLSHALDRLADQVRRTAPDMASCTFLLYDDHGRVRQAGASGHYPHARDYLQRLVESRELGAPLLSDEVMRTGRPEIATGWHARMLNDPRFAPMRGFTQRSDWDTIVVVPLLSRGEPIGVFNGFYREGACPDEDDVQFLLSIADQAAIAVDMFSLRDRAQREAAREERHKLARDLHDSVSQMLFTLNLQAAAAARIAAGHDVEEPLNEIRSLSDEAFAAMRQLILGTRPGDADEGVDLTAALRQHVDALRAHSTVDVEIDAPEDTLLLSPDTQEQLFRVVQESLHNAVRHAPGARVKIRLSPDPRHARLRVEVSDDGPGFDTSTPPARAPRTRQHVRSHRRGRRQTDRVLHPGRHRGAGDRAVSAAEAHRDHHARAEFPLMTDSIRVMIVDDHTVVRHGLRAYLDTVGDIDVVAEATDGRDALDQLAKMTTVTRAPDVVLVDLQMPRMNGEETTAEVVRRFPAVRVVVMTSFSDVHRIQALLQAGAAGYILKRSDETQIDAAIRAAHAGEVHLDPVVARVLTQTMMHRDTPDLTARELEVVRLLARGLSNEDIAHELTMSERTARTHVSNILMKLGLQSRTQAALWAIREGIETLT